MTHEKQPTGEADQLDAEADAAAAEGELEEAERLRSLARRKREAEQAANLVMATKGESMNFDLIGKVLAERMRRKEQRSG